MYGILTIVGIVAAWWVLAATVLRPLGTIPTPAAIVSAMSEDSIGFYMGNASVTAVEALTGYAIGVGAAFLIAVLVLMIPRLTGVAMQVAVISYCIPIVAIGPVIYLIVGAPQAGDPSGTAVILAAMAVFFTTLVGSLLGLASVDQRSLELVDAFGGSRWTRLFRVQLISAVPSIINALKIAAPSAVLGAILGEYVGGVDRGIGPALVSAQLSMNVERTWGLAFTAAILAGGWFALMSVAAAIVNRLGWRSDAAAGAPRPPVGKSAGARAFLGSSVSILVILLAWPAALAIMNVSPYVGKTPWDVWEYLVVHEQGPERVAGLFGDLAITLGDAGIGFIAGLGIALIASVLFLFFRPLQNGFMPIAILLQSVPLIAMAPVIILVFGRGITTVAVMAGLIVFFPALVNITYALRETPPVMTDLVQVYGAGRFTELFMVRLPACVPAVFASIRIAIPGAIAGALLAEWLATGQGLGYRIISALGRGDNTQVWACVVLITGASLALYSLASFAERVVGRKWGSQ